jgi:carboxyl-terminal processing protease
VRLTIIPPVATDSTTRTTVSLVRDKIKLEEKEAKAKIIEYPTTKGEVVRLGIIDLPSFYAPLVIAGNKGKSEPESNTTKDVARLIKKLEEEKVSGIILDLRRNGGGSLDEAIKLTGLFIKEGPVVQVQDPDGAKDIDEDDDPTLLYDGPLVVLTSRFSASASEIVAGALQDYGRALIVGDASTHGKGTVQSLQQLATFMKRPGITATNDPGALKFTIRKFYRPKGSSTQLRGVVPDIILPSVNDYLEVGESSLDDPLPWDTITSAPFEPVNRIQPYLAELEKNSARRVASEKDFGYVREDIERVKRALADKTVSLNEEQRLKEKDEEEIRRKARDQERLARKETNETVYKLTLKQVDLPGLPPPESKTNNAAVAKIANDLQSGNVATNSVAVTPKKTPADSDSGLEDEGDEEIRPQVDIALEEAKHILVDYLSLLPKGSILSVTTTP